MARERGDVAMCPKKVSPTSMSVRHGHLPYAKVREYAREELSESQRHDQLEVVPPRDVLGMLSHTPQTEERSAVHGYGQQLDHRHGHGIRKFIE